MEALLLRCSHVIARSLGVSLACMLGLLLAYPIALLARPGVDEAATLAVYARVDDASEWCASSL